MLHGDTDVWPIIVVALVALAVNRLGTFGAGVLTHLADLRGSFGIRRELLAKPRGLPLGWFTDRNAGVVKTVVDDVAHRLSTVVAAGGTYARFWSERVRARGWQLRC